MENSDSNVGRTEIFPLNEDMRRGVNLRGTPTEIGEGSLGEDERVDMWERFYSLGRFRFGARNELMVYKDAAIAETLSLDKKNQNIYLLQRRVSSGRVTKEVINQEVITPSDRGYDQLYSYILEEDL
jgi:hypothetical protein